MPPWCGRGWSQRTAALFAHHLPSFQSSLNHSTPPIFGSQPSCVSQPLLINPLWSTCLLSQASVHHFSVSWAAFSLATSCGFSNPRSGHRPALSPLFRMRPSISRISNLRNLNVVCTLWFTRQGFFPLSAGHFSGTSILPQSPDYNFSWGHCLVVDSKGSDARPRKLKSQFHNKPAGRSSVCYLVTWYLSFPICKEGDSIG